jgi:hypothetical protein
LPNPVVPLAPVTVNEIIVVDAAWLNVRETLDIWEQVMFPLIARSTVAPVSVVAETVVAD